jgi:NADH-quinone oxidoreductase subunit G
VVHPDGRLQRLRPAVAHPHEVRPGWRVLCNLAARLGVCDLPRSATAASEQLFAAVPFYAGLTLEEIGGRGVRWQQRAAAGAVPAGAAEADGPGAADGAAASAAPDADPERAAALAGYRSLWAAPEVAFSPSLAFLAPERRAAVGG